jgi:hypothetical protein
MKPARKNVLSSLLALLLLTAVGCSEKADEAEPVDVVSPPPSAETVDAEMPINDGPAEVKTATVDDSAAAVDIEKPISEVQAEAKAMSIENLKATALKYKEAILGQEDKIKAVSAKLKEIPMVEALGEEAKSLKTELKDLGSTLTLLKDRFQVYYDTLKEKGGDLSGLAS